MIAKPLLANINHSVMSWELTTLSLVPHRNNHLAATVGVRACLLQRRGFGCQRAACCPCRPRRWPPRGPRQGSHRLARATAPSQLARRQRGGSRRRALQLTPSGSAGREERTDALAANPVHWPNPGTKSVSNPPGPGTQPTRVNAQKRMRIRSTLPSLPPTCSGQHSTRSSRS